MILLSFKANPKYIFCRHTYRYTPLLAWLLLPGHNFPLFGKIIFILFDWASACLIYKNFGKAPTAFYLFNPLTIGIAARGNAESIMWVHIQEWSTLGITLWIPGRHSFGNNCNFSVFVCLLALVTKDFWWLSGPLLALAVHLKTYPAPWALTIWLYLAGKQNRYISSVAKGFLTLHGDSKFSIIPFNSVLGRAYTH